MWAQAKTYTLVLYNGQLNGMIRIENANGIGCVLYYSPREAVSDLFTTEAFNKFGVYILLSSEKVYVGQSSDLEKRISQHKAGKDFWESVVIFTETGDNLDHSDIDYLEYVLIEKAQNIPNLICENKKGGNPPKVKIARKIFLDQYLEAGLFLMQLIGKNVFITKKIVKKGKGEKKKIKGIIPALPDDSLKTGLFIKTAMENLAKAGYVFTDDLMEILCSEASMNKVIGMQRKLPFFKIYNPKNPDGHKINGQNRYYSAPLTFGAKKVYLCLELYEGDKEPFIKWYKGLC